MVAVFVQFDADASKRDEETIVIRQLGQKAAYKRLLRELSMIICVDGCIRFRGDAGEIHPLSMMDEQTTLRVGLDEFASKVETRFC